MYEGYFQMNQKEYSWPVWRFSFRRVASCVIQPLCSLVGYMNHCMDTTMRLIWNVYNSIRSNRTLGTLIQSSCPYWPDVYCFWGDAFQTVLDVSCLHEWIFCYMFTKILTRFWVSTSLTGEKRVIIDYKYNLNFKSLFICRFLLLRVKVDLDSVLGILGEKKEYTLGGTPVHHRTTHTDLWSIYMHVLGRWKETSGNRYKENRHKLQTNCNPGARVQISSWKIFSLSWKLDKRSTY